MSLVLAAMSAMLFASTVVQSDEGLVNPGFESGTEGWASLDASLQTSGQSHSGSAALVMTSPSYEQAVDVFQWRGVQPGWAYEFSAWVVANSPGIDRVFLRITWLNAGYSLISTTDSAWLTSRNPNYTPLSTGFRTAPQGAVMARVGLFVIASGPFTALVDDTSLAVQAAPTPPPTAVPTPPPPPVVTPTPAPNPDPTPRPSATPRPTRAPGGPTAAPGEIEPVVFDALTNGSFELMRDDGTAYGWRNVGGQDRVVGSARVSGARSLELSSSTTSTKWAYQTIRVAPGAWVNASAWAKPVGGEAFLRLSWYASADGSGQALDSDDSPVVTHAGSSFQRISTGSVQVPAEARTAKVRLVVRPDSEAPALTLFDDAALGPAEPAEEAAHGTEPSSSRRSGTRSVRTAYGGSAVSAITAEAAEGPEGASGPPILTNDGRPEDDEASPVPIGGKGGSPWEAPLTIVVLTCLAVIGAILFREVIRRD